MVLPVPVSASQCTCQNCGAEFYLGNKNPSRFDDYLIPTYCPVCGGTKSLSIVTMTATTEGADPSRAVDFDGECSICSRTLKEHSVEGIQACAQKQRDIKLKDVRCPICNKLVLEHSHSDSVACFEKDRASKQG
jgi:DNA-directed RNA polymerase subunit RPC12/RpoP